MAFVYTKEQREQMSKEAEGKVVKRLYWSADPDGSNGYWVMEFTDGSEVCIRFMAELQG